MRGEKTIELWKNPEYRKNMCEKHTQIHFDLNKLKLQYEYGISPEQLSKYYNCCKSVIFSRLKKANTKMRVRPQKGAFRKKVIVTWKMSDEGKEKLRLSKLGSKNPMFGKPSWLRGKKATLQHRINLSLSHTGKEVFDGFVSTLMQNIRRSGKYFHWRLNIYDRDNRTCMMCNTKTNKIVVHHITKLSTIVKKNNIDTLEKAYECKDIWDSHNGITLCKICHDKIEKKEEKYKNKFKEIIGGNIMIKTKINNLGDNN